jgi:hypothetical protein
MTVAGQHPGTCFERGTSNSTLDEEKLTSPLYEEIGRLKMEVDFLKKKC